MVLARHPGACWVLEAGPIKPKGRSQPSGPVLRVEGKTIRKWKDNTKEVWTGKGWRGRQNPRSNQGVQNGFYLFLFHVWGSSWRDSWWAEALRGGAFCGRSRRSSGNNCYSSDVYIFGLKHFTGCLRQPPNAQCYFNHTRAPWTRVHERSYTNPFTLTKQALRKHNSVGKCGFSLSSVPQAPYSTAGALVGGEGVGGVGVAVVTAGPRGASWKMWQHSHKRWHFHISSYRLVGPVRQYLRKWSPAGSKDFCDLVSHLPGRK